MAPELKQLEWDSKFFGRDVFRLDILDDDFSIENFPFPKNAIIYVFAGKPIQTKFKLVDKKVTFANPAATVQREPSKSHCQIDSYKEENLPALLQLSRLAGGHSRFRVDKLIPQNKADELFELWLKKALSNNQDYIIHVARQGQRVAGMSVLKKADNCLFIDLISVFDDFQGQGVGKQLMQAAAKEAIDHGLTQLEVTTQLDNVSACKLYEKAGLIKKNLSYIYHIHT